MRRVLAAVTGLIALFFVFYTVRLLVVTGFLRHTRVGGGGAYIGAIAFPLLAIGFGWMTVRLWKPGPAAIERDSTAERSDRIA
jgi:hypothetical protein